MTADENDLKYLSESLLPVLIETMSRAAFEVQRLFSSRNYTVSEKSPGDFLTSADLLSNEILQKALTELLPEAVWISEESALMQTRQTNRFAWVVDPIDGTREFARGIPEYSISVGLVSDGYPILGAVALPADSVLYAGGVYAGVVKVTEKDRLPVRCRDGAALSEARILVSDSEYEKGFFSEAVFSDLKLQPTGSVARKLALVAGGMADASISLNPKNEWDICGGIALVLGAGGRAVHFSFDTKDWIPHRFNNTSLITYGLIAGSVSLVDALSERQKQQKWSVRTSYGRSH